MERIKLYLKESYNELLHEVSWPNWASLQATTSLVLVASVIIAILIFLMDLISKQGLGLIYRV